MNMNRGVAVRVGFAVSALGAVLLCQPAHCQAQQGTPAEASTTAQQPSGPSYHSPGNYKIGENDVLAISVWNEPDMRQAVPVRPDGRISLPLIGDIQAAGRTPEQLQADIATKLQAYITHPDVTVIVQQMNSKKFNILGRVVKPGAYLLTTSMTVLDAIAQAGGFQDFAKQKAIYVLRDKPGAGEIRFPFNYKDVIKGKHLEQNIKLEPNDTIIVP